jgi:hypothetical protein
VYPLAACAISQNRRGPGPTASSVGYHISGSVSMEFRARSSWVVWGRGGCSGVGRSLARLACRWGEAWRGGVAARRVLSGVGLSAKQDCHLWGRACRWRAILARPASCRCLPSGRSSCPVLSHRRVCCVRLRLFAAPTLANVPSPSPGGGGASACAIFLASCGPTGLAYFF